MRFILFQTFSGVTRTGCALYDADKFGTGVPSEVERFKTDQEAIDYVATKGGIIVEPSEPPKEDATKTSSTSDQTTFNLTMT